MNDPKIIDTFGRTHDYLRISLTERCNLRCVYCMPEEGVVLRDKAEFMTAEETLEIAQQFVDLGVKKIRLTGGEPLIKRNAETILRGLGEMPIELTLTTNGILVDRYIDLFKEVGIRSINVSLDSLVEERFTQLSRRNYYERVMNNISLLNQNGIKVKINVVLIKGVNDDEIIDFIELSRTKPYDIRFIEFMPFDGNNWDIDKKVSFQEIIDRVSEHYGVDQFEQVAPKANDTARNFKITNGKGSFGIISTVTNPFCDSCNRIRLTADGKIKNCLFSNDELDLLSALRSGNEIAPLIHQSIRSKKKERAGHPLFTNNSVESLQNRSMITIGG